MQLHFLYLFQNHRKIICITDRISDYRNKWCKYVKGMEEYRTSKKEFDIMICKEKGNVGWGGGSWIGQRL
jgi:hypothetical protein